MYAGIIRHKWGAMARRFARSSATAEQETIVPSFACCEAASLNSSRSEAGVKKSASKCIFRKLDRWFSRSDR
jgi:hypothetical protein